MSRPKLRLTVLLLICAAYAACTHKPQQPIVAPSDGNYPDSVSKIIISRCTYSGCHNQASYQNAAGLLLDSWGHLFNGSNYGAEVVAFSPKYSPFLYYCNNGDSLIPSVNDPGHLDTPLTSAQYLTLKNWIIHGAPDKFGNIPFAANADTRQKIYLTNQACNLVAVIDGQSKLVMRYIAVGGAQDQTPHDIEVSGDGSAAYIPMYDGHIVQKIDTRTDTVSAYANLASVTVGGTTGSWSIVEFSPQDTELLVSGFLQNNGSVVAINTSTMQVNSKLSIDPVNFGSTGLVYPHGLAANASFDTFFTTLQYGNTVYKYTFNGGFHFWNVSVDGNPSGTTNVNDNTSPNPHQIEMTPDYSKYFVSCQRGFVSVIDAHTNALIDTIHVGYFPQEMALSTSKNYLFVACMEDPDNPQPGRIGSVYVIDYNSLSIVAKLYGDFYEPHDIAVDEVDRFLYVTNRNVNGAGAVSHHSTICGGNPGWYTVYSLDSLRPADNKRYEVTRDPYAISPRF